MNSCAKFEMIAINTIDSIGMCSIWNWKMRRNRVKNRTFLLPFPCSVNNSENRKTQTNAHRATANTLRPQTYAVRRFTTKSISVSWFVVAVVVAIRSIVESQTKWYRTKAATVQWWYDEMKRKRNFIDFRSSVFHTEYVFWSSCNNAMQYAGARSH